jgi:hypothetical protein
MNVVADAMSGVGAALLPVAAALLFEELTFGGLVRLLLTPWPRSGKRRNSRDRSSSLGCRNGVPADRSSSEGCESGVPSDGSLSLGCKGAWK